MNIEQTLKAAEDLLAAWNKETSHPEPARLDAVIEADDLHAAALALHVGHWGYLSAITGLDLGPTSGQLEVLYHFCSGPAITTLRVRQSRDVQARVPSIAPVLRVIVYTVMEFIPCA